MRIALVLALAAALAVAGCGGSHRAPPAPKPPRESVSEQLRQALQEGFHPTLGSPLATARAEVLSCSGPPRGAAGTYTFALRPHRSYIPRSLPVKVDAGGGFQATIHARRSVQMLWGAGLRLPGR
jgi:hypothetical protein